jgi:small subunit ribosomal protein S13e
MGRMHSSGKGMSKSARPYRRTPPSWLKVTAEEVEENICKFAKKGLTPSQIGVILRDSHGIAQVKSVTGSKVLRILKKNGMYSIYIFVYNIYTYLHYKEINLYLLSFNLMVCTMAVLDITLRLGHFFLFR